MFSFSFEKSVEFFKKAIELLHGDTGNTQTFRDGGLGYILVLTDL